jgi:hypothetical protein
MKYIRLIPYLVCIMLFSVHSASAQERQALSVTPPLFQLSALPGDIWQSSVKVVNSNRYPLTVYTEVVNFKPVGESGQGSFVPLVNTAEKTTLASWISASEGPHVVPPEQSKDISFIVEIPNDAPPGGHYAAILVSTEPPETTDALSVKASQAVTSLFFVRIEGDVEEAGTIREFRALDSFLARPNAEFSLRFENKGNVHLQPRGDIVITNMWGTERGVIPVNYQTHFGNVLPESIRDFRFTWRSDFSITDIGRYKAIATLAYGEDGIKSTSATTYFWVIPLRGTLITLLAFASFIALVVYMVKAYVRRMLVLAGVDIKREHFHEGDQSGTLTLGSQSTYRKVSAPIRDGVLDLRKRLHNRNEKDTMLKTVVEFIRNYKIFFISLGALIVMGVLVAAYIGGVTDEDQQYEVIIKEPGNETILEGSDIELRTE